MIRQLAILAVAAIYLAASTTAEEAFDQGDFGKAQKMIFDLLWHVDQPDKVHPEIYKIGDAWDIEANMNLYDDEVAVKEFLQRYRHGMLSRGHLFSVYYPDLVQEAVALFKVFYSAVNRQTFFNTASWARIHMNEGLFGYAFYLAVIHRKDEFKFHLPLPSEIMPNYIFNKEVMQEVYDYKMTIGCHGTEVGTPEPHIVMANYTHWYASYTRDPETALTYFLEDVGLNNYYFFVNQEFPYWMSSAKYNLQGKWRGEFYYYIHKTLLNRYRMERYAHGLPSIEHVNWDTPIVTGYLPAMTYRNGFDFPARKENSMIPEHKLPHLRLLKAFESRLMAAVDYGYYLNESRQATNIYSEEGFNMLGNMVEGNADSVHPTFYGSMDHFYRSVLGFSPDLGDNRQIVPSALEHFLTSMRDPAFYRIYQRILSYFKTYKQNMDYYTRDQLIFNGVQIDSVAIDKLSTYFDWTDSLISNAALVHDHQDAESFLVKARQYRLNHKPFTYHITVKSMKETKAVMRIFLGPEHNIHGNEYDISQSFEYFYELDYFTVDLTPGFNKIERKSNESDFTVPDFESGDIFYQRILDHINNGAPLPVREEFFGFPDRLILPKGTAEGLPVKFFFYISEFDDESSVKVDTHSMGEWIHDGKPFGFPLDRPMYAFNFTVPNMYFKTAHISHVGSESPTWAI